MFDERSFFYIILWLSLRTAVAITFCLCCVFAVFVRFCNKNITLHFYYRIFNIGIAGVVVPLIKLFYLNKAGFPSKRNARNEFTQAPANRNRAVLFPAKLVV